MGSRYGQQPALFMFMPDRILLVDDEKSVLLALREHFINHGYQVDCAGDSDAAHSLMQQQSYSTAVVDLSFSASRESFQGLDLIGEIRQKFPLTKIIALTGHGTAQIEREARDRGASAFMTKPPKLAELAVTTKKWMVRVIPMA